VNFVLQPWQLLLFILVGWRRQQSSSTSDRELSLMRHGDGWHQAELDVTPVGDTHAETARPLIQEEERPFCACWRFPL